MSVRPTQPPEPPQRGALPDLSIETITRLVAGRCYWLDVSAAVLRTLFWEAEEHEMTVVPAGCEADLRDVREGFAIQGPLVVGRQLVWTSANIGPSEPFEAEQLQEMISEAPPIDGDFESLILELAGPATDIGEGIFLCNTGPLATGMLVFGVAGSRDEAEMTGGEYVWGRDMANLFHQEDVIGEMVARIERDEVAEIDFSTGTDRLRREQVVPYADEPVYFLIARYD